MAGWVPLLAQKVEWGEKEPEAFVLKGATVSDLTCPVLAAHASFLPMLALGGPEQLSSPS